MNNEEKENIIYNGKEKLKAAFLVAVLISAVFVGLIANISATVYLEEDMESGPGLWTWDGLWDQSKHRSRSGNVSWYYGNQSALNYTTTNSTGAGTRNMGNLTSPYFDLTTAASANLTFWMWYETEGGYPWYDQMWVQISEDWGPFVNEYQINESIYPSNTWVEVTLDISSHVGHNVSIRFYFDTMDALYNDNEGWYIDDVVVYDSPADLLVHTFGSLAPPTVTQGDTDIEMLALRFGVQPASPGNFINITSLRLDLTGTGTDTDISAVRLYDDVDEDQVLTPPDNLLGTQTFSGGTLTFSDLWFTVEKTISEYFIIVFDINLTATVGAFVGCGILDETYISVAAPDEVDILSNYNSSNSLIQAAPVDSLDIVYADLAPPSVNQGQTDVEMITFRFSVAGSVNVTSIRVDLLGTGSDIDISDVRLINDVDTSGTFTPPDVQIGAAETFSGGTLTFSGLWLTVNSTTPWYFLILYNISVIATPGATVGCGVVDETYITVAPPDIVTPFSFYYSTNSTILAGPSDTLIVDYGNLAPGTVMQGDTDVIMMGLRFFTNTGTIYVTSLTLDLTGTGTDTDVSDVRFYDDVDESGTITTADNLLGIQTFSGGTLTFSGLLYQVNSGFPEYFLIVFNISATATVGNTVGCVIVDETYITVGAPDIVGAFSMYESTNSTIIGAPGSSFKPPHDDFGYDSVGDGLLNYLVVNTSVYVNTSGIYYIYSELYDLTGTVYITYAYNYLYLNAGDNIVQLNYTGSYIYNSGIDGPYNASLYLYDEFWILQDTDFHITNFYDYNWFKPPAELNPPYSDFGLDTSGNGYFEYLVVNVWVNVTTAGDYYVWGDLYNFTGDIYIVGNGNASFLNPGIQLFQIYYSGPDIYLSGIDGPYNISLYLQFWDGVSWIQIDQDIHITFPYLYTFFERPTHFEPPHDDYGLDTDSDILYDFLVVNATVNVTMEGWYWVYGDLFNQTGSIYIDSLVNYTYLTPGIHAVQFYFSGMTIYSSGVDGPYNVSLALWDDFGNFLDSDFHITDFYLFTWFNPPTATLNPPHQDYALDTSGSGYYNYLIVNVSVNVTSAGDYYVYAILYDQFMIFYITSTENYTFLNSGIQEIQLYFPGGIIYQSGIDGPYNISLELRDGSSILLDTGYHGTGFYSFNDFDPPSSFEPPHSDYVLDTDSDTYFDYLIINVSINVTYAGWYTVEGYLYNETGSIYIGYTSNYTYLDTGIQEVQLYYNGMDIFASGIDGPYLVMLDLYDDWWNLLDSSSYLTSFYLYDQFQHPGAQLQPPHEDYGLDLNGDGFYDFLVVNVTVNVTTAGDFRVRGWLYDQFFMWYIGYNQNITFLNPGVHQVQLYYSSSWIYQSGINGPYALNLQLRNATTNNYLDGDSYLTNFYNYNQFRPAGIFDPPHDDYGLDTSSDGYFEFLVVNVTVNVTIAGNYTIEANLWDHNWTSVITSTGNYTSLNIGINIVQLYFSGLDIYSSGFDGPYNVSMNLYDELWNWYDYDEYLTNFYQYNWFTQPNATFLPPHSDYVVDVDGDGRYDWLIINVSVNVTFAGNYQIRGWLNDQTGTWFIEYRQNTTFLNVGIQIVKLAYYGPWIYRSGFNGPYLLNLQLRNATTMTVLDTDSYLTNFYLRDQFLPDAIFDPPHEDYGLDTNGDGEYDYLVVNITVNVTQVGIYTIWGDLFDSTFSIFIASESNTTFLTPGIHVVQLYFDGYLINQSLINGPYYVALELLNETFMQLDYNEHLTNSYTYSQFRSKVAQFQPPYEDYGLDTDSDTYFNYLVVNVTVDVVVADNYQIYGQLWDITITTLINSTTNFTFLSTGIQVVQLYFVGVDINVTGINGPYWVLLILVDSTGTILLDDDFYITGTYTYDQFQGPTLNPWATATGPVSVGTNNPSPTITYSSGNSPTEVWIYWSDDGGTSWVYWGNDTSVDGTWFAGSPLPASGTYYWNMRAIGVVNETTPIGVGDIEIGTYVLDIDAPSVDSTTPLDGEPDIAITQDIIITFNEPMNNVTFTYTIEPNPGGLFEVWTASDTVITISHADFLTGTRYWVNITAATDLAGNNLDILPYSFYFDTWITTANATGPIGGPTNVAGISILYSTVNNPAYVDVYYTTDTTAPYTWIYIGTDNPADGSFPHTILTGDGWYSWFVRTSDWPAPGPSDPPEASYYIYDGTQPDVSITNPAHMATGVSVSQNIIITFDENMTTGSFVYTIEPNPGGLSPVWSVGTSVVTISHNPFTTGTRYWVNITAATDLAGNNLITLPYSFYFDTATGVTTALASGPIGGPTNVASITILYSTTGSPATVDLYYTKNTSAPFTWTIIGTDNTPGDGFGWTIDAGDGWYGWIAKSPDEAAPTSSHTPEIGYYKYDGTRPDVLTTIPAHMALDISVSQNVIITFNDNMTTGSFVYTIEPNPGGLSEIWSPGDTVVTISHNPFATATRYWVNITAATDLAGNDLNPLPTPYSFYFDTAATAATATGPISGPTNVAGITILYSVVGSPASVDLYYTKDTAAPFTWTLIGTDNTPGDGFGWTIDAGDGWYSWFAKSPDEAAPTSSDSPEIGYYKYDATQPGVTSTDPANMEPDVPVDQNIVITFDENMTIGSFTYTMEPNPGGLSEVWSIGDTVVTISHSAFATAARYWINITTATDLAGNNLNPLPYSFYFDTAATGATATGPIGGPTNVAGITILYSVIGSPASVDLYYTKDTAAPFTWTLIGTDNTPGDGFGWTIDAGDGWYSWFAKSPDEAAPTSSDYPEIGYYKYDSTPPDVSSTDPFNMAMGISVSQNIIITFNENMTTGSFIYTIEPDPGGLSEVWSFGDTVLTIYHADFANGTRYWVNITAATDLAGNALSILPYSFYFDTVNTATASGPISGPTNVAVIIIQYSTEGNPVNASLYYTTNTSAPYIWTLFGTDSPADGSFGWTIPADGSYGWIAVSPNETAPTPSDAPEASYYEYDGSQPEVTSTTPTDMAPSVPINQIIKIYFNETMDTGTFTYTVEPDPGGLSVGWSGTDSIVSIDHNDFAVATRYWVNITAVTDLAGNSLSPLPYSFYFDTAITAAIATGPISGPTNVAVITILYSVTGGPVSVDLYYTKDTAEPYTWTIIGTDNTPGDGSFGWTIDAGDGWYSWFAKSPDEPVPTTSDAPEASYYKYDGTQPDVTTTIPTDAGTDVNIDQDIVINFDEPIVNGTFTYTVEPTPVGLMVSWNVGNTSITISHTNFTSASRYWVNITTAFDPAGNSLFNLPYSFYFDTIAFTGTATGPVGGPTNVANIDITYTTTGSPSSVDLYYTTDMTTPYTWDLYGTDFSADGIFQIDLLTLPSPSDSTYGWIIVAQDETAPTSADAPEASYYIYDGTAPEITGTIPVDDDDKVSTNQSIIITFSEPIDTATWSFTCTPDPGGWTISWNATNDTVTLNHTAFLDLQTYIINIIWANDTAGNALVPYEFTFTTEEDVTPPTIISIVLSDPSPTTMGGVTFTITFSEDLDTLFPPTVTFGETSPYDTYTIDPTSFSGNTWIGSYMIDSSTGDGIHNISVSGARDLMGNPMVTDTSFTFEIDTTRPTSNVVGLTQYKTNWTFDVPFTTSDPGGSGVLYVELYYRINSTGSYSKYSTSGNPSGEWISSPISFVATADGFYEFYTIATDNAGNVENAPTTADAFTTIDTTLPTVVSIVLSDPSPTTAGTVTFTITFSEDLNPSESPTVTFGLASPYDTHIIAKTSFSGNTWIGEFTITTTTGDGLNNISVSGARDLASNLMVIDTSFTFIIDTVTPSITDLTPTPSEEDVPVTTSISITFNEDMDHATVESAFNFTDGTTVWTISNGSVSWVGNVMTFTPTVDLDYNTQYTVNVGTGAKDLAGLGLPSVYSWSFTTVESPDITPPTIISVTPGISAVNVDVRTTLTITFSEPMNHTSLVGAITISPGVTISDYSWVGNTLTITFSSDLEYSTDYNITIGTSALDEAGNALGAPYSWEFTTTGRVAGEKEAEPPSWIPLLLILIIIIVIILLIMFMKLRGGGKKEELPEEEEAYAEGMEEEEPEAIDEEMPEEEYGMEDEEIPESEVEAPEEPEGIEEEDLEEPEEPMLDEEIAGEEESLEETGEPETEELGGTEKEPMEETGKEAGEEAGEGEVKKSEKTAAAKGKKKGKKRKARKKKRK